MLFRSVAADVTDDCKFSVIERFAETVVAIEMLAAIGVANEAAAEIVPTSLSEPAKTAVLLNKAETVAADAEDNCKFFVRSIPAETVAEVAMLEASDVNNDADAETDPISEIDPDRLSVLLKLELVVAEADIAVDRLDAVERFAETVATVVKLPARDSINPASADTEPTSFIDPEIGRAHV